MSKTFDTPDHYASAVVAHLTARPKRAGLAAGGAAGAGGFSRKDAVKIVQGNEASIRNAYTARVSPEFLAARLARTATARTQRAVAGLAAGGAAESIAFRSPPATSEHVSHTRAGFAVGESGSVCAPWIPPLFVSPEVAHLLEAAVSDGRGHVVGAETRFGGQPRRVPRPDPTRSPISARIISTDKSWSVGISAFESSAKYVSSTANAKVGAVDITHVSIGATCVDCSFKTEKVCYAMGGQTAKLSREMTAYTKQKKITADQASVDEAACIDASYGGGPVPSGRVLRLHASGDTSTPLGAQAIRHAVERWKRRGGGVAYTYTHAWRRVPRKDFGVISVLASLNPGDNPALPLKHGYNSVTGLFTIEDWSQRMIINAQGRMFFLKLAAPDIGEKWNWIPCPAQYPSDLPDEEKTKAAGFIKWHRREAVRFKALFLAKRIAARTGNTKEDARVLVATVEQVTDIFMAVEYSPHGRQTRGVTPAGKKAFEKLNALSGRIVAAGLPAPDSEEFRAMFRAVGKDEKATCDTCTLCHDDQKLGRTKQAIAFRGDQSGGIIAAEALVRRVRETIDIATTK